MAKATNPDNIKGKGFDKHPENINRTGRPKKLPDLDALLIEVLGEHVRGKEAVKNILIALRKKATAGDVRAAELLLDRAYGKTKQQTEISGAVALQPITGMQIVKDDTTVETSG